MTTKEVAIRDVKPESPMVAGEVIKVHVSSLTKGDGAGSPDAIDGDVVSVVGVCGRCQRTIMSTTKEMAELRLQEEGDYIIVQDILVNVAANNGQVALTNAFFKFVVKIFEEGFSGVAIIIVVLKVSTLLSVHAELS